jgi:hypothetical protein
VCVWSRRFLSEQLSLKSRVYPQPGRNCFRLCCLPPQSEMNTLLTGFKPPEKMTVFTTKEQARRDDEYFLVRDFLHIQCASGTPTSLTHAPAPFAARA